MVNCAVFDAHSSNDDNDELLYRLTQTARAKGLVVDLSALAFKAEGRVRFYGDRSLLTYLSHGWIPDWTHTIEV